MDERAAVHDPEIASHGDERCRLWLDNAPGSLGRDQASEARFCGPLRVMTTLGVFSAPFYAKPIRLISSAALARASAITSSWSTRVQRPFSTMTSPPTMFIDTSLARAA